MPKPELFRMSTGQIVSKARVELEAAASAGQPLPPWFEYPICIITPAGRRKYEKLLSESEACKQSVTAAPVTMVEPASAAQVVTESPAAAAVTKRIEESVTKLQSDAPVPQYGGQGEQYQASAAHDQAHSCNTDLQTVMQERSLTLGEPCEKCGCPLERDLFGELVCCRCYPARGYYEYADLVDQMYPRKHRPKL